MLICIDRQAILLSRQASREREHQTRNPAKQHAGPDEYAYGPGRALRPGTPEHHGENKGDNPVEKQPAGTRQRPKALSENKFQGSFRGEIKRQAKCERN